MTPESFSSFYRSDIEKERDRNRCAAVEKRHEFSEQP